MFFYKRIRQRPRSTQSRSSAASDVYKGQTVSQEAFGQRLGKAGQVGILIGYWQQEDVPQALQLEPEVSPI